MAGGGQESASAQLKPRDTHTPADAEQRGVGVTKVKPLCDDNSLLQSITLTDILCVSAQDREPIRSHTALIIQ